MLKLEVVDGFLLESVPLAFGCNAHTLATPSRVGAEHLPESFKFVTSGSVDLGALEALSFLKSFCSRALAGVLPDESARGISLVPIAVKLRIGAVVELVVVTGVLAA